MSSIKKAFIILFAIVMSISLIFDGLYLIIKFCLPSKVVVKTFNVSDLIHKKEDGTTTNLGKVMELSYYANEDGSGVELLDVKLNILKNEKTASTFSTGLQIVGGDEKLNAYLKKYYSSSYFFGGTDRYFKTFFNGETCYYNVDGNNASYVASLNIEDDSFFLITIGEEQFRMHIRKNLSDDKAKLEPYFEQKKLRNFLFGADYDYIKYDWNYLVGILLKSVQSLEPGFDGSLTFKFGDIFDYYKYDEEKQQYSKIERTKTGDLINEVINNYYTIKVNTYYSGAKKASDSLFNMIEGDYKYNLSNEPDIADFDYGREIIQLDEYDFDFIQVEGKKFYKMKLKDNIKNYVVSKKNYRFDVKISKYNLVSNMILLSGSLKNEDIFIFDEIFNSDTIEEVHLYDN